MNRLAVLPALHSLASCQQDNEQDQAEAEADADYKQDPAEAAADEAETSHPSLPAAQAMTKRFRPPAPSTVERVKCDLKKLQPSDLSKRLAFLRGHWPSLFQQVLPWLRSIGKLPAEFLNDVDAPPVVKLDD